jgi:hypothetical protein
MLVIAVLMAISGAVMTFAIFYFGGYLEDPSHSSGHLAVVGMIALYPSTLIGTFLGVALAFCANEALNGRKTEVRDALTVSWHRIGHIAAWSLLAAGVGLLLEQIASRLPGGGRIATWLAGAAWALATLFVVPILALEEVGPIAALKRSGKLIRSRWGEGIIGTLTITFWTWVAMLPAALVLGFGAAMSRTQPSTGVALMAVGLALILIIAAFAAAVRQVFAVALYRFATDGSALLYSPADLQNPFYRRGKDSAKGTESAVPRAPWSPTSGLSAQAPPSASGSPEGWYPDPLGSSNERYWDGSAWTATVRRPS